MTDHAGLIERLNGVGFTLATDRKYASDIAYEAASAIVSLVKERDALKIESSKHAYEADKAKQDRDTSERRSEDFWSGRAEAAEARCARMKEALRPFAEAAEEWGERWDDSFVPVLTPDVSDPDDDERSVFTVGDLRRARQALEEQG